MRIARRSTLITTSVLALTVGGGVAVVGAQVWTLVAAAIGLLPAGAILAYGLRRPLRRLRLSRMDLPPAWRSWLHTHVPLYNRLDPEAAEQFERDVQFAMHEYSFEGVEGVQVTDDLRLGVAAGIATLLHGRPEWELPGSRSVLFYPGTFNDEYQGRGVDAAYDGMAHQQGPLILTAAAVEDSWRHPENGDNVVLHELAHLFDFDNTGADGVPSLVAPGSAGDWQALVQREMKRVREGRSILRPYAAEAPSEFFAVAVEVFFEQPFRMARHHDALFRALVAFFSLDPRTGERTEAPGSLGDKPPENAR